MPHISNYSQLAVCVCLRLSAPLSKQKESQQLHFTHIHIRTNAKAVRDGVRMIAVYCIVRQCNSVIGRSYFVSPKTIGPWTVCGTRGACSVRIGRVRSGQVARPGRRDSTWPISAEHALG